MAIAPPAPVIRTRTPRIGVRTTRGRARPWLRAALFFGFLAAATGREKMTPWPPDITGSADIAGSGAVNGAGSGAANGAGSGAATVLAATPAACAGVDGDTCGRRSPWEKPARRDWVRGTGVARSRSNRQAAVAVGLMAGHLQDDAAGRGDRSECDEGENEPELVMQLG